jgi:hypothetical protein
MRDAGALCNVDVLPWDCWGAVPREDELNDEARCAWFDRLAALTQEPDRSFAELRRLCQEDPRLRVQETVRNAVRRRDEPL